MEAIPCHQDRIHVYLRWNLVNMELSGEYRYMSWEMFIVLLKTIRPSNRRVFTKTYVANAHVWEGRVLDMYFRRGRSNKYCTVTWPAGK